MTSTSSAFANLVKNSSMMFLLNLAAAGVSVFTIPIMISIAGVGTYGHLVLVQSLALTAYTLCSFQYWQGMLIALPGYSISVQNLRRHVWTSVRFDLLGMAVVVACTVVIALMKLPQTEEFNMTEMLMLAVSGVLGVLGTHSAYFRLVNRYNMLLIAGVVSSLLKLICLALVAHFSPSVLNMVLAFTLPEFVRCTLLFIMIARRKKGVDGELAEKDIDPRKVRDAARWSTLQAISELPVVHLDRVIIGFVLPGAALGIFTILRRIYWLVNMATSPFYSTSIPEFAARANNGDIPGAFALWRRTMAVLFGVTASAAVLCLITKGIWMPLLFPVLEPYLVEFGIILVTAVCAGTFVTTNSLYWALGHLRQSTVISVVTNLIYLCMLGLLTWVGGLTGGVSAFLIHVLLVAGLKIFLLSKVDRSPRALPADSGDPPKAAAG